VNFATQPTRLANLPAWHAVHRLEKCNPTHAEIADMSFNLVIKYAKIAIDTFDAILIE